MIELKLIRILGFVIKLTVQLDLFTFTTIIGKFRINVIVSQLVIKIIYYFSFLFCSTLKKPKKSFRIWMFCTISFSFSSLGAFCAVSSWPFNPQILYHCLFWPFILNWSSWFSCVENLAERKLLLLSMDLKSWLSNWVEYIELCKQLVVISVICKLGTAQNWLLIFFFLFLFPSFFDFFLKFFRRFYLFSFCWFLEGLYT